MTWEIKELKAESPTGSMYTYDIVVSPIQAHFDPEDVHGWANAHLVAAAPDLLRANVAALEACVECSGDMSYDCTRAPCPQIRAAITKARGK